jgi:hypothetical protein
VTHKTRRALDYISRITVMAAIVTTLLYLPVGVLLAWLCYGVLGTPFQAFLTFADTFNRFQGLVAWWMVLFLPALAYATCVLPWSAEDPIL